MGDRFPRLLVAFPQKPVSVGLDQFATGILLRLGFHSRPPTRAPLTLLRSLSALLGGFRPSKPWLYSKFVIARLADPFVSFVFVG